MPFRRIDPMTVVDEFGNTMWMPEMATSPAAAAGPIVPQDPMGQAGMGYGPVSMDPSHPDNGVHPGTPSAPNGSVITPEMFPAGGTQVQSDSELALRTYALGHGGFGQSGVDPSAGVSNQAVQDARTFAMGMGGFGQSGQGMPAVPVDPYGPLGPEAPARPAVPMIDRMPTSSAEAERAVGENFNDWTQRQVDLVEAGLNEQRAMQQREVGVLEQGVKDWDKQNEINQRARALATAKADQETADWLTEQQRTANQTKTPQEAFSEKSEFVQAMFLVSVMASAIGSGGDASKNVGLKLLEKSIEQDIQAHREKVQRQVEVGRQKGEALTARHQRDLKFLGDNEAAGWQRWNAVERAALAKAKLPGPEAQKRALAEVAAVAAEKKGAILENKAQALRKFEADAADRAHQARENAKSRAIQWSAQKQQERQFNARLAEDQRQHGIDTQKAYDLAPVSASTKETGPLGIEMSELRVIPKETNFVFRNPKTGEEKEIVVPKEQHKQVAEGIDAAAQEIYALSDLRKALSKTDWSERAFKTDAEFVAAVEGMAGARVKVLNKGATSENDRAVAYKNILGYDLNSAISQAKGPSKDEMLSLIDKQIDASVRRAPQVIRNYGGVPIPEGMEVTFVPRGDLAMKDEVAPSTEDTIRAAGGVLPESARVTRPKTHQEYYERRARERELPGSGLPKLPPELESEVTNFVASTGKKDKLYAPHNIESVAAAARHKIAGWKPDDTSPAAKEARADAMVRIQAEAKAALSASEERMEELRDAAGVSIGGRPPTVGQVSERARELGLDLTPGEVSALIDEAKRRAGLK